MSIEQKNNEELLVNQKMSWEKKLQTNDKICNQKIAKLREIHKERGHMLKAETKALLAMTQDIAMQEIKKCEKEKVTLVRDCETKLNEFKEENI